VRIPELLTLTLWDLVRGIESGEVDPREYLDLLESYATALNPHLGLFLSLDFEKARDAFHRAPRGRLWGIPLAIKDNIHVKGFPTTCASRILEGYRPPFDATAVERLRMEGAIFFGKTNMDEFAMGSSTENSAFMITRNPWDLQRVPGGSSGGGASAVASFATPATLGSDTGGSIRQPSAFCGITGLKPTYGRVSRYGLVAFASSLDQIGPMARTARDCALLLSIISGEDPRDSTTLPLPPLSFEEAISPPPPGLRLGIPEEYFQEGLDPEILKAIESFEEWARSRGDTIVHISLPHTPYTTAVYYILATAEASSNLARYDGIRYGFRSQTTGDLIELYEETRGKGFGREVKRRILLGTFVLSSGYYEAYYGHAQKVRTLICQDLRKAFEVCDLILTPTTPTPPFPIGSKIEDPLAMYLSDIYTNACNLAGVPGISFPVGFTREGLPVGAQLMAPPERDDLLLRYVHAYQQESDHHKQIPRGILNL